VDFLNGLDRESIADHEDRLVRMAMDRLSEIPGLKLVGTAKQKAAVVAFVLESVHPHDVGTIVDLEGVAIRTGHHCCMPLMTRLGLPATARASFAMYNTESEVESLAQAVEKAGKMFA
jgi:cysteine desulfurase/selenocysteine lyase